MVSPALIDAGEAQEAAARARVEIRELDSVEDLFEAGELFASIWGGQISETVPLNLLRALAHSGNYVTGAFQAGRIVAASVGFVWGSGPALHSHISGVAPDLQGSGIGYALKLHQRSWAAEHGLSQITWTFDPLVRRNAWFNLVKLGARAEAYHPDFYGPMDDGINSGDATDRCVVIWRLDATPGEPRTDPAEPLLVEGASGEPVVVASEPQAESISCQVPLDVVELRRRDPDLARRWRHALRETMGAAMEDGYVATTITTDGRYLLALRPR